MRQTHFTKALCFLLSFCMVFSGFVFAAPAMEMVETAEETVTNKTETAALNEVGVKPGLNMLTQTTEPFGYETEEQANSFNSVITEYYTPKQPCQGRSQRLGKGFVPFLLAAER